MKWKLLFGISFLTLIFDQWSKLAIVQNFKWGESLPILHNFFHLTYVRNTGAAFGFLSQTPASFREPFFTIVPLVALSIVFSIFKKTPEQQRVLLIGLSLVMSGAVGNVLDRFQYGYVIDFLDFHWKGAYHFPAFNVADSCIFIGVSMMLMDMVLQERQQKQKGNHVS